MLKANSQWNANKVINGFRILCRIWQDLVIWWIKRMEKSYHPVPLPTEYINTFSLLLPIVTWVIFMSYVLNFLPVAEPVCWVLQDHFHLAGTCVIYKLTMIFGVLGSSPLSVIMATELLLEIYCELFVCNWGGGDTGETGQFRGSEGKEGTLLFLMSFCHAIESIQEHRSLCLVLLRYFRGVKKTHLLKGQLCL